jgi:hypothetical protein
MNNRLERPIVVKGEDGIPRIVYEYDTTGFYNELTDDEIRACVKLMMTIHDTITLGMVVRELKKKERLFNLVRLRRIWFEENR